MVPACDQWIESQKCDHHKCICKCSKSSQFYKKKKNTASKGKDDLQHDNSGNSVPTLIRGQIIQSRRSRGKSHCGRPS